jgi:hypothetical protein
MSLIMFVLIFFFSLDLRVFATMIRKRVDKKFSVCRLLQEHNSVAFVSQSEMKLVETVLFFAMCAAVYAITVEEAWENYRVNPKKPDNPDWVKPIPNFETFKRQWDEAKAYNAKYATTQDAWKEYKVKI